MEISKEEREQLITVVRSLRKDCLSQETTTYLISKLISMDGQNPVLTLNERIEGIKKLVSLGLMGQEDAQSYGKRLLEIEIAGVKAPLRHLSEDGKKKKMEQTTG